MSRVSRKINNKKYYSKLYEDEEKAEKRRLYYKRFRERNKDRILAERRQKYQENKKDILEKRKMNYTQNGKFRIRKDGLTIQQYRTRKNLIDKIKALQIVGKETVPACCKCGEMDIRVLTINHINGGGNKEKTERRHAKISVDVLKGRLTDDLDIRCFNCNIRYEYEQGRRFTPVDSLEIYESLCVEPLVN